MSDGEKIEAFDAIAAAMTSQLFDGSWRWWCGRPCGGEPRLSRQEAVADFIAWAKMTAKRQRKPRRLELPLVK